LGWAVNTIGIGAVDYRTGFIAQVFSRPDTDGGE
jgi:hypothetical protein